VQQGTVGMSNYELRPCVNLSYVKLILLFLEVSVTVASGVRTVHLDVMSSLEINAIVHGPLVLFYVA
jgi:hypothetical protein